MHTQFQKIGSSKGKRRVCLWNKKIGEAGFPIGQPIQIQVTWGMVLIFPDPNGKRKVSRVMNHGNELPVIDLKETKSLDLSSLGEIGGKVEVTISDGRIIIKK